MPDIKITIPTTHGDVVLPYLQMVAMSRCLEILKLQGKEAIWHRCDCDCCVVVHEVGSSNGYLIGEDGEYDWIEHKH